MRHAWNRLTAGIALTCTVAASVCSVWPAAQAADRNPELTVYNQNFALVKDYRTLQLKQGLNTILLDDVAGLIDPTSVLFKALDNNGKGLSVREQNFRYDLISKTAILDRMVGKKIKFKRDGVMKEGILLNPATTYAQATPYYNPNVGYRGNSLNPQTAYEFAIKTDEGVLLTAVGDILVDEVPSDLYPRPTLAWLLNSDAAGSRPVQISYLTDGVTWNCDYVALIHPDDNHLDLQSWVTINNRSAATYRDAKLKLVAGDVNRVQPGMPQYAAKARMRNEVMSAEADGGGFKEESFFEYHLYTLQGTTTVANNETKQITLVSAKNIPVEKTFLYDPDRVLYITWLRNGWADGGYGTYGYYTSRPGMGAATSGHKKVSVLVKLKNAEANNLGIPLPKGKVRVNKADSSGSVQFIGEDWIDHTPKDETVELYLGDAFDLVAEKKQTNYVLHPDVVEQTYSVNVRNRKKEAATVQVVDHLFGDWQILNVQPATEYVKEDARTVRFPVTVPAGQERTISYTVRIKRF